MPGTFTSNLEIINRALQLLGEGSLISLTDQLSTTDEMNAAYRVVRDAFIRSNHWNCCIRSTNLALLEKIPNERLGYVYSLPSDYLGLLYINGVFVGHSGILPVNGVRDAYKIRGKKLITYFNPPLKIEYAFRNEDVSDYDPLFCECLAIRLAMAVCERITSKSSHYTVLKDMYTEKLAEAMRANAIETPATPPPSGNWINGRRRLY